MSEKSHENLKTIHFEGEVLPRWAQLLDLAAKLCPVPEETRRWFSRFTNFSAQDDAKTVLTQCEILKKGIQEHVEAIKTELQRQPDDQQPSQICAAWIYALDTMIQQASSKKNCVWEIEEEARDEKDDPGGGDVKLRRV